MKLNSIKNYWRVKKMPLLKINKMIGSHEKSMNDIGKFLYWNNAHEKGLTPEQVNELCEIIQNLEHDLDEVRSESYDDGYDDGNWDGRSGGYDDGYCDGKDAGYDEGYQEGYEEGVNIDE